jgi:hypothetical protein
MNIKEYLESSPFQVILLFASTVQQTS